jgi:hypothetical protein
MVAKVANWLSTIPPFGYGKKTERSKGSPLPTQEMERSLLPLSCEIHRASGHSTATLTTDPGTRAERFYRLDGWTEVGRREDGQIIFQKAL